MMSPPSTLAWGGPIGWLVDKVTGFVGDVAAAGFEAVVTGLVGWVTDAVLWVVAGVFNFFLDAQDPNVQADWFITGDGPYATTATIGATLMVGFLLAGIAQGALQGDVGGMVQRIAVDLPASVLGIVGLVTVTQALIRLTDELSTMVMAHFEEEVADFVAIVTSLSRLGGSGTTAFVILLLGLVTVLAGLVLVAELAVRAALVYIVVALAPLVFAARLWPALKGIGQKLLRLLCGLILAKLAMAVALAVASAAAVGTGSGGEVTSLPEPEVFAEDPGGSVTQAVGILLAATAAFGVASFMPFFVVKLLPLAEDAAIAHGLRSGPLRAAQQGMSMAYYAQTIPLLAQRFKRKEPTSAPVPPKTWPPLPSRRALPAGPTPKAALRMGPRPMPGGSGPTSPVGGPGPGSPGVGGSGGTGAGAGAGASGAAAGPAGLAATAATGAAKAAKGVAQRGAQAGQQVVESATGPATAGGGGGGPGARSRRPSGTSGTSDARPIRRPRPPRSDPGGGGGRS